MNRGARLRKYPCRKTRKQDCSYEFVEEEKKEKSLKEKFCVRRQRSGKKCGMVCCRKKENGASR